MMRNKLEKNITKVFLIILGVSFAFTLYWMFTMSFKEVKEIAQNPFGLPIDWDMKNYAGALEVMNFWSALKNSMIYTFGTCVLTLIVGSMAAYAVSRMRWKYENSVRNFFMLGLMIPANLVMVPLYSIIFNLGLKGTPLAAILPYSAFQLPSTILMLYAFLRGIPKEMNEAAILDGCNAYQCFLRVFLPILKPAISTRFILIFINIWNEFNLALVLVNTNDTRPLPIELNKFFSTIQGVPDWGRIGAAMLLTSLPVIIVYTIGSSKIENALCAGAIMK